MPDQTLPPRFEPGSPLPGPPEPWTSSTMPEPRDGPPYLMTEMIAAEPALAERLLRRLEADPAVAELAGAIQRAARADEPIRLTGCGTSEHAAQAIAVILGEALLRVDGRSRAGRQLTSEQAFEAALEPQAGGLILAVSHEGGTWATNRALDAARAQGARTAMITAGRRSPGAVIADIVVATGEQDQSWCHTVGYLSPLVAAVVLAGRLTGRQIDPGAVSNALGRASGQDGAEQAEQVATALKDVDRVIVLASGADRPAARELALKIEEAAHLPATTRDVETLLHGHLPAADERSGLVLILADRDHRSNRLDRARQAIAAAGAIGVAAAAILAEEAEGALAPELTPAGRIVAPEMPTLPEAAAALLGTAVPLQLLTERLARARGTNPDTLRRTDERYRNAAATYE